MGKRIELHRLTMDKNTLAQIPNAALSFLFMSSHAVNEISFFSKLMLMSLNTAKEIEGSADILRECGFIENVIVERNLNSKIVEYYNMVLAYQKKFTRKSFHGFSKSHATMQTFIDSFSNDASYDYAIWLRNQVTNHYLLDHVKDSFDENDKYTMILHEKIGNSKYNLSEELFSRSHFVHKLDSYNDFSVSMIRFSRKVIKVHHKFCSDVIDNYFPNLQPAPISVNIDERLSGGRYEVIMPLFFD